MMITMMMYCIIVLVTNDRTRSLPSAYRSSASLTSCKIILFLFSFVSFLFSVPFESEHFVMFFFFWGDGRGGGRGVDLDSYFFFAGLLLSIRA